MNGCDFTPSTRTQSSEQENSYLTASKRHPSTSHTRNTPNAFPKLFFGRLPGFIENLLESANLFCNAAGATQTALGVRQLLLAFFRLLFFLTNLAYTPGRLSKEILHSLLSPVLCVGNGDDQFTNLSMPFPNAMTLDTKGVVGREHVGTAFPHLFHVLI